MGVELDGHNEQDGDSSGAKSREGSNVVKRLGRRALNNVALTEMKRNRVRGN